MTEKLNEYINKPTMSPEAWAFIEAYNGGEVPQKIRAEMIRYVQDMQPVNEKSLAAMTADFDRILSQ